jgi:lipooligosaccharide transport system permease protein
MPIFLQWIGWISPLWHSTNLSRALSYGLEVEGWLIAVHLIFLLAGVFIGLVIGRRQFARRLAK